MFHRLNSSALVALAILGGALPLRAGDVAERLAAHPVLARLGFARAADGDVQVFVATVGAKPPQAQAQALLKDLSEAHARLVQACRSELTGQMDALATASAGGLAVVVLADDRTYEELLAGLPTGAPLRELAIYDVELGAVLTRVYPDSALAPERRRAVLQALVGAWLDRAAGAQVLAPSALREGLAGRLVHAALEAERAQALDVADAAQLATAAQVPLRRLQTLPALDYLWRPRDAQEARQWIYERARGLALAGAQTEDALALFYAQARAWCWYFEYGADGRYRAGWHTFLAQALGGSTRLETLGVALGVDPRELEPEFLDAIFTEYQRSARGAQMPLDLVAQVQAERATAPRPGATSRPRGAEADGFRPARLAPSSIDPHVQLGLALCEARTGALEAAVARLAEVIALSSATDDGARAAREHARLSALRAARLAWAEVAGTLGAKLFVERDGKRTALRVERFEGGRLHFARNRLEIESLALEALEPARAFPTAKDLPAGAPDWAAAYAHLLAGDAKWARELGESAERSALEQDAQDFAELLRTGEAARELETLARTELDQAGGLGVQAAESGLAAVARLVAMRDLDLVASFEPELRAFAELALGARHDAQGGVPALAGRSGPGPAGSLRVVYAFDAAEEAADFELLPDALPEWHASMAPVPKAQADSYFVLRQGAFFGDGQLVYRHRLRFTPPVRVTYQMRYIPRQEDPLDVGVVMIGLGGNGQGTFAAASEFGDVYVTDPSTGHSGRTLYEGERVVSINTIYECEARLERDADGLVIEAWRDGALRNELPAPNCGGGEVFLFVHSPRIVALESLVIEGQADAASLAQLRGEWIVRELAALGL